MLEIERKFLVKNQEYQKAAHTQKKIVQGFLSRHPERTVRVRIQGDQGLLTIKGRSSEDGTSRMEWEYEIPLVEAKQLLAICESGIIEKVRYEVMVEESRFEVDAFLGDNQGLVLAEIELPSNDAYVPKPSWLGKEVTGDIRYYNSQLSKNPYQQWKEN